MDEALLTCYGKHAHEFQTTYEVMMNRRILLIAALAWPLNGFAQTAAVIAPPSSIVEEGVPAVPAQIANELKRYTETRLASFRDWHPLRREMLIGTRFGNTTQVHEVRMPLGMRRQLTFFDEPVNSASYEPKSGSYFIFGRDAGGNEFGQLYRYDLADGAVTLLTDGGRSQNGGVTWSNAGDRIVYASTRRNGADRDLYVMDPRNPRNEKMLFQASGGGWSALDWSPDDNTIAVEEYLSINRSRLWLVDVASGAKKELVPEGKDTVAWSGAFFSADGRGVFVTTDKNSEFLRLAFVDLATRKVTPLTSDINWDVESYTLSPDRSTLAFAVNEGGWSRLYFMDTKTREIRAASNIPAGIIRGLTWHRNNRDLGFSVESARAPSDVYSVDVTTGAVTRWTESELGGLVPSELAEPQLVRWPTFDKREITGFIYKPHPSRFPGKRPVIINIHGGPEGQSRPGFIGRNNYFINDQGIAMIFPNVRGSDGFGKTFVKLDNGMKREDSVKDIGALLDWVAQQPELDASKVMITGASYGGYMTLAVATTYNDRICCSIDIVGISNFNTFLKNTESYRRDLRRVEYGDERDPAMAAFFERMAPLNKAGNITRPLTVVQGANDPRVPRTEAEQMVARVKQNGSPVWYILALNEGHGFQKKNNQDYQFYAAVLFVKQYLLGNKPAS